MDSTPHAQSMPENPKPQTSEVSKTPEALSAAPAEAAPNAPQAAPAPLPASNPALPQTPTPVPPAYPTADNNAVTGPAIADDVDVIEKEWVEKAQEVIEHTKDDPYQEEEQIEDLQADYLKKRYGKDIKSND